MTIFISMIGISAQDFKIQNVNDEFVNLKTKTYEIELPKGWQVTPETFYGQRTATPTNGKGELGIMTAPPSQQTWDEIYDTSLYFIMREQGGKATPYKKTKTKRGYEAATFDVTDKDGFSSRRYVLIKHESYGLLALSVKIPSKDVEKEWTKYFQRMVDSAKFANDKSTN